MKKIVIAIIIIALVGVGYFLFSQFLKLTLPQTSQQQEKTPSLQETGPPMSEKIPFNTNDNLNQAIEDLKQIE